MKTASVVALLVLSGCAGFTSAMNSISEEFNKPAMQRQAAAEIEIGTPADILIDRLGQPHSYQTKETESGRVATLLYAYSDTTFVFVIENDRVAQISTEPTLRIRSEPAVQSQAKNPGAIVPGMLMQTVVERAGQPSYYRGNVWVYQTRDAEYHVDMRGGYVQSVQIKQPRILTPP